MDQTFVQHVIDAGLDCDLGNFEAIPDPFLLCGRVHYPAERAHSQQGVLFP